MAATHAGSRNAESSDLHDPTLAGITRFDLERLFGYPAAVGTWHDPEAGRPIAAPLERCAELLGVDLATVCKLAAGVEPYIRADGTEVWSLMLLERQLRPERFGRRRGGYVDRRRRAVGTDTPGASRDTLGGRRGRDERRELGGMTPVA